ncbi:MAG: hypothetical protein LBC88_07480, partial [Spirochaetaceae bacterium]|nr:hypothetical protein [Spirochaetaceae bacterium]
MKIICPNCNHLIEKENINVENDYGFCTICQNAFNISSLLNNNSIKGEISLYEEIINNPPKGTWKYEDFDKITIG